MSFVASKNNRAFSPGKKQQKNEIVSLASVKFRYFNRVRIFSCLRHQHLQKKVETCSVYQKYLMKVIDITPGEKYFSGKIVLRKHCVRKGFDRCSIFLF